MSGFISQPEHWGAISQCLCNIIKQIELAHQPPFSSQKKGFLSGSSLTNLSLAEKDNNNLIQFRDNLLPD